MHLVQVFRLQRGWSIPRLASNSKLTPRHIRIMEEDPHYNAKYDTMKSISEAFNLPASLIFFPEENLPTRQLMTAMMNHCLEVMDASMRDQLPSSSENSSTSEESPSESEDPRSPPPEQTEVSPRSEEHSAEHRERDHSL